MMNYIQNMIGVRPTASHTMENGNMPIPKITNLQFMHKNTKYIKNTTKRWYITSKSYKVGKLGGVKCGKFFVAFISIDRARIIKR